MGLLNSIRTGFKAPKKTEEPTPPIFRWDGKRWYQANTGFFNPSVIYDNITDINANHNDAIILTPSGFTASYE